MALTPEDVVNKRFQSTKFREGYDQDEVDDFLDEIVVEFRRLNQENDELKQRLTAADARIAELQRSGGAAPAAEQAVPQPVASVPAASAPAYSAPAAPAPASAPAAQDTSLETTSTNNLLQLARRLHEEHVREGIAKRDELIAEGQATAARLVSEAEGQQRQIVDQLQAEKTTLEARVEELRVFEREYRNQLRTYIQGQLRELEGSSASSGQPEPSAAPGTAAGPVGSAPVGAPGSAQFPGSAPSFGQPQQTPGQYPGYSS
ncbi:DivIVA domain-containing protein [Microcella alkalica]|uniref:Cell wall synthesis protein Wag31 n=1 Tax=Microcella alkalica TaxID=355930 RepID=A0A839E4E7_9MICO|nr:DivIVA domain-containing protein [Microcella alkalica]MBA8847241.1 DivIVA domain-containing protein [Microcella alkalica]